MRCRAPRDAVEDPRLETPRHIAHRAVAGSTGPREPSGAVSRGGKSPPPNVHESLQLPPPGEGSSAPGSRSPAGWRQWIPIVPQTCGGRSSPVRADATPKVQEMEACILPDPQLRTQGGFHTSQICLRSSPPPGARPRGAPSTREEPSDHRCEWVGFWAVARKSPSIRCRWSHSAIETV